MKKENSPFYEQDVKDLFMNIEEIYDFNKWVIQKYFKHALFFLLIGYITAVYFSLRGRSYNSASNCARNFKLASCFAITSDLLALHKPVFPLSFPFGRLPRTLLHVYFSHSDSIPRYLTLQQSCHVLMSRHVAFSWSDQFPTFRYVELIISLPWGDVKIFYNIFQEQFPIESKVIRQLSFCFTMVWDWLSWQIVNKSKFAFNWFWFNNHPGPRGFLLFFLGKFCDTNRFFYFFHWHKALRAEKRKPLVKTVESLTFMPSAFERRFWLGDIFNCSIIVDF